MEQSIAIKRRKTKEPLICLVCGDVARGLNFEVITCMSCKAFFRRNALEKTKLFQCRSDNKCQITVDTRGQCCSCRLKKCFSLGMNPDLIRSPYETMTKRRRRLLNEQIARLDPIGLLQQDVSSLNGDEWNLLSNLISAYENENPSNSVRLILKKNSSLPLKVRSKRSMAFEVVTAFFTAVEPIVKRTFIFRQCPSNIRRIVVENNLSSAGAFVAMISAIESNAFDDEMYISACKQIYGARHIDENARVLRRFDSNHGLLKMVFFILAFANNSSIVAFDQKQIVPSGLQNQFLLRIQNSLTTILWKYFIYHFGFYQAAIRFSNIIKSYLDVLRLLNETKSDEHWKMVDNIVDQFSQTMIYA